MKMTEMLSANNLKCAMHTLNMKLAQTRPEWLLVTGLISMAAATICIGTKTEECKKVVEECKEEMAAIEENLKLPDPESGINVLPATVKANKIEKGRQYMKAFGHLVYKLTKIYGASALLWFGGASMVVGGHVDLRKTDRTLAAQIIAGTKALADYRSRVQAAVGTEEEERIFMGAREGEVVLLEKDEKTGKEKYVKKKADEFYAQPGSIFAINFVEENFDFKWRTFPDEVLNDRIKTINQDFKWGLSRAYSAMEILRKLGCTEAALGNDQEKLKMLLINGISGNAQKVPDPEMRELKVTRLNGYQKKWDQTTNTDVWVPCVRLDFNFYPLEGKI